MATTTPATTSEGKIPIPSCIPNDPISQAAYHYAKSQLHPLILQHSIRVYLYAQTLGSEDLSSLPAISPTTSNMPCLFDTSKPSARLFFLAAIFHDIGTCPVHDHAQRFEVCGADAAVSFVSSIEAAETNEITRSDLREIWTAISLHTSPGLPERMSLLTRLLRIAVKADFGDAQYRGHLQPKEIEVVEADFPRGEIEKMLGDCVAKQAEAREDAERATKAPQVSWPWNLLRARLEEPEWEGVNKGF